MNSMENPYSFRSLSGLELDVLRELIDTATKVLQTKHTSRESGFRCAEIELGTKRARTEGNDEVPVDINKGIEMRASEMAGDYVLTFGKHKDSPLRRVDMSYLTWILGFKRNGQKYSLIDSEANQWIQENNPVVVQEVRKYLSWRCWMCRSTDVKFSSSRFCRSCFASGR